MPNSPGNFFVRLFYTSAYAPHVATLPTGQWNDVASTNPHGQFVAWDESDIDALDMIEALVDILVEFYPATVTFNNFIIYSQLDPANPPIPLTGAAFTGKVGTNAAPGWSKAVSLIMNIRSEDFGAYKVTMLDAGSGNTFDKIVTLAAGKQTDLFNEVSAETNAWSARDNSRPTSFLSITTTLNEKLRRAYRMM